VRQNETRKRLLEGSSGWQLARPEFKKQHKKAPMNKLIVVFSKRRRIGLTAIPYNASIQAQNPIVLHEQVTQADVKKAPDQYSESEKEVVNLLSKISDQALFKKFSHAKSVKEFKDNIPDDLLEERIRPDLEKTMYQLFIHLTKHPVPAYFKNEGYTQLYSSDRLRIKANHAQPIFRFSLKADTLIYTLRLKQDEFIFTPTGKKIEIICHNPAVLKINHDIFHFKDFSAAKIKPFLDKPALTITAQHLPSYMEGFVANCIRLHEVEASGFVIEKASESPAQFLVMEKDLTQKPVLNLYFQYGQRRFLADRQAKIFVDLLHDHRGYTFRKIDRNLHHEQLIVQCLEDLELTRSGEASFTHPGDLVAHTRSQALPGPENLVEWVRKNAEVLAQHHIETRLKYEGKSFSRAPVINHFVSKESADWFEIEAMVEVPPFQIPFVRFRKHILRGERLYTLPNGEVFVLPGEWFSRFTDLFNFGETQDLNIKLNKVHSYLLEQVIKGENEPNLPPLPRVQDYRDLPLPQGLKATLRPYQIEGFHWLKFLSANNFGGILADDMGLGKTIQAITFLLNIYSPTTGQPIKAMEAGEGQLNLFSTPEGGFNKTGLPPTLIVMPTSLVHNWESEIRKFAPSLKVNIFTGGNRARSYGVSRIFRHYHIVITTYGVLRNDVKFFKDYQFQHLILDESQYIKNPSSKSFAAVKAVNARHHLVLTGTPIENSLVDLWAQMNVVNQDLLGSLSFFQRHFVTPIAKNENEEKSAHLQKLIQPFMLRRTKEMVAKDLPPIMEQVVYCEMTPEQKSYYESEKSSIRNAIFEALDKGGSQQYAILALKSLTRLRQIANHPATVEPDYTGGSGKFDQMMETLESIISEHHHVLVFSSFVKDLKLMEHELSARKIHYAKLTGATQNRQEVIETFSRDDRIKVFLISLKAGGVGLNLTKADYVFMLNPWWNPAAEAQAINRAHRIGQVRNVFVYRFISTETIEEKIARLQEKKSLMADTFVKSNNPLANMSPEEMKELFG
jgi:SNF2 family DNA or RNA helicase